MTPEQIKAALRQHFNEQSCILEDNVCPYMDEGVCCHEMLAKDALALIQSLESKLPPKRESRAMLPCKCGSKRREHWFAPDSAFPEELRCAKCGFTVKGFNATDVIRKWNEAVKEAEQRADN